MERVNTANMQEFVGAYAGEDAKLYTDESAAYNGIPNRESVKHCVGEYVSGQAHINGMESFWALLKRGYYGTYHKMSVRHLPKYINEFEGGHNARSSDTLQQMRQDGKRDVRKEVDLQGIDCEVKKWVPKLKYGLGAFLDGRLKMDGGICYN